MLMESQMKFHNPQNISWSSQQNTTISWTTGVDGDLFENVLKTSGQNTWNGSVQHVPCNPSL